MNEAVTETEKRAWPELVGAVVRGVVLGSLLMIAIIELVRTSGAVQVFRYQGF